MSKRANGEGSIYRRKSDGRWSASITLPGGKRKHFLAADRDEVVRKQRAALKDQDDGLPIVTERQTVAQYLKRWLAGARPTIRERTWERDPERIAELSAAVADVAEEALVALDAMRRTEGAHLHEDLEARRRALVEFAARVAEAAAAGRSGLETRLAERVAELSATLTADRTAIAQEIVRFAGRSDISEELSRFRAHLAHWAALADADEPCGRKLDFLLQEMNREVNTMGSKADGLGVSEPIILAKAELERMREQIQNVE